MRKGKENVSGYDSSELEPEIEARFHALKTKQVWVNHTQPDFTKLHYQQLTTIDHYGKPKTVIVGAADIWQATMPCLKILS